MEIKKYTVQHTDTLGGIIIRFYGVLNREYLDLVVGENGIKDPNVISVGQELRLPGNWGEGEPNIVQLNATPDEITQLVTKTEASTTPSVPSGKLIFHADNLPPGDYWRQEFKKRTIVLHFTAGYTAESAIATFRGPGRVATPFVVGTDGVVHQLFDEKYWSYHLGEKEYNENWVDDKESIGIEIVNIGPVWNKGGVFKDYVGKEWSADQVVVKHDHGADGAVKFPAVQVDAVCKLVNLLIARHGITRQVPVDKRSYALPKIKGFHGILTHQHYRRDKYDLGVGWSWTSLIDIDVCNLKEVAL